MARSAWLRALLFSAAPEYTRGNLEGSEGGARMGWSSRTGARACAILGSVIAVSLPAAALSAGTSSPYRAVDVHNTKAFWSNAARPTPAAGSKVAGHALRFRARALDTAALEPVLALAPRENTVGARATPLVLALPAPNGKFERFALVETEIMAPRLAARHPGIHTYGGRGLSDPSATIHPDLTPLGFHASVRSSTGIWYVDPYLVKRNPRVYASYYTRYAKNVDGVFVEREPSHADRALPGSPEAPAIGEQLRTYRLALITDPGYAAYFGGPPNVTPAKVALINRVDQPYEDDMAIRLQLVPNNDLLNLDTWALATAPNGPCGAAACFTQSQVTGCSSTNRARYVIGQIIGASQYDIGHLALGPPGGGVANLGVSGPPNKAGA